MGNREKLINIISRILKDNILTKKELERRIKSLLVKNNDARKINSLVSNIFEEKIGEDLKDKDVELLIQNLFELVNVDIDSEDSEDKSLEKEITIVEEEILSEDKKILGLYNEAQIEIQKLKNELLEKTRLENELNQTKSKLKKFENLNIEKILEENQLFTEMFKITGTDLIEVPDEDIDALYLRNRTHGIKEYKKAFIANDEIIPKTYYKLKGSK